MFDIIAWGISVLVGFFMGVTYSNAKWIGKLIDWKDIRERFNKDKETKDKLV